jgi:glycine dehydrogenase subunit 2
MFGGGRTMKSNGTEGLVLNEPFIFELQDAGACGIDIPEFDIDFCDPGNDLPDDLLRKDIEGIPDLTEPQVIRHYTRLSTWNYSLDGGFYPLGSCTMKYNPKINEAAAAMPGFANAHPYLPDKLSQGMLQLLFELQNDLTEISGLSTTCLHPAAGSHGELLGMLLIRAYHDDHQDFARTKIIIPDSAHGTNPASAAVAGLEPIEIKSNDKGLIDLSTLESILDENTAGIMITNPNTCGVFENNIIEICEMIHKKGGLVYMDGANMNALVGKVKPGAMGVDVLHFNTHKTFSTPHGGGGPGAGPVSVAKKLEPYLPKPVLEKNGDLIQWKFDIPKSIGQIRSFFGNIGVLVRAYTYIKTLGSLGLRDMTETAVLNANYMKQRLEEHFNIPFADVPCMHEVLLTENGLEELGITTMDIAKGLIENGFHPPTVYFPLIVQGAMLIEPTETESMQTMDEFIDTMVELKATSPEKLHDFPIKTIVGRVDEVLAARKPKLKWRSNS